LKRLFRPTFFSLRAYWTFYATDYIIWSSNIPPASRWIPSQAPDQPSLHKEAYFKGVMQTRSLSNENETRLLWNNRKPNPPRSRINR
jgi:hypothetical protein